jgi:hypothetical protein
MGHFESQLVSLCKAVISRHDMRRGGQTLTNGISPALRITLGGIAALAQVKRPVVSMWRQRLKDSDFPFPPTIATESGQEYFDAQAVAHWLVETRHGNNPEALADAAAHASIAEIKSGDDPSFHALTAVLALRAAHAAPIGGLSVDALLELADAADPDDQCLLGEVDGLGDDVVSYAKFVDVLVDSAYSAPTAFERIMASRFRDGRREIVRATLSESAIELVSHLSLALAATNPSSAAVDTATIVDPTGVGSDLLTGIAAAAGESVELTFVTADCEADAARLLRRRLLVHQTSSERLTVHESGEFSVAGPVVNVAQYPSPAAPHQSPLDILNAIDSIVLQMDDAQRGVIIAPASVLCDGQLSPDGAGARSALLRSGRIRGIVRLPMGLLPSSPRLVLALWVLGPAHEAVAVAERWTMVADLIGVALKPAAIADLVSDLTAAMGNAATVRAHSFRFTRRILTSTLLARTGALTSATTSIQHTPVGSRAALRPSSTASVALRVDDLLDEIGKFASLGQLAIEPVSEPQFLPQATLADLVAGGHLRYVPGTRLAKQDVAKNSGFPVVGVDELSGVQPVVSRTIDRLLFGRQYPSAQLTEPGDVVFCTGSRARAWVDCEGASVVEYPARVLRISRDDSAGLLPDVLAADIENSLPGVRDWRRWTARRVSPEQRTPLLAALTLLNDERTAAAARLAQLDELTTLLTSEVTAGRLTLAGQAEAPLAPKPSRTRSKGSR